MQRLGSVFSRRSAQDMLRKQGVQSLRNATPLFECRPPLYARWTWPLVTAQLVVCAVGGELIMNQWTRPVESESKDTPKPQPGTLEATPTEPEFELRPLWQRLSMMGVQIAATATFCMVLFRARSRTLHKLYVLPSGTPGAGAAPAKQTARTLVLQNVWQFSGQGRVLPLAGTLERGSHDAEVVLSVPEEGNYRLPLADAKVNGQAFESVYATKEALFKEWYGPKKGVAELAKQAWVD